MKLEVHTPTPVFFCKSMIRLVLPRAGLQECDSVGVATLSTESRTKKGSAQRIREQSIRKAGYCLAPQLGVFKKFARASKAVQRSRGKAAAHFRCAQHVDSFASVTSILSYLSKQWSECQRSQLRHDAVTACATYPGNPD